jgi:hypothetical protein
MTSSQDNQNGVEVSLKRLRSVTSCFRVRMDVDHCWPTSPAKSTVPVEELSRGGTLAVGGKPVGYADYAKKWRAIRTLTSTVRNRH